MFGAEIILALSHPLVVALLGGAVLLIWRYDAGRPRYLLYFGVAYLAYSLAVTVQTTRIPSHLPLNILLSGVMYLSAIALLSSGLVALSGNRYKYAFPIVVSLIMLAGRMYFTSIDNDTKARLYLLNGAAFILLLHGCVLSRELLKGRVVEKILYFSFLGLTLSTVPRVFSGLARPAGQYGFDFSAYWLITQFSIYIFAVVFIIALILTIMQKRIFVQRELSETDALTGLRNRRGFMATGTRLMSRIDTYAIIIADIDHFKNINDTYGHAIGDEVLTKTAAIIEKSIRPLDVAGRIGGDEFAIFLPHATTKDAHGIAERLRKNFEQFDFLYDSLKLKSTISIGVTACATATSITQSLTAADLLLYQAKTQGRNRVVSIGCHV